MKQLKTWFLPQLILAYTFLGCGVTLNILELLAFLLVWPFNRIAYRRIVYYLSYSFWAFLVGFAQYWSGCDFNLYIKDEDLKQIGKERTLAIMNHKYDIDWLLGYILCQRISLLAGTKVVMKSSTKYVPIIGWSFWFAEYIFLNRIWEKDKELLVRDLNNIFDYPKDLNYCIVIMCEGTRFTQKKYEASVEVAKQKGLPILKHHLLPRTKGFTLVASQIKGKIDYIYDINLAVQNINGSKPTLMHLLNGLPAKFEIALRRIPVSSIPIDDENQCADWLQKHYKEKDDIFDVYDKNGDFSKVGFGLKKHYIKKNGYDLIVLCSWLVLITVPSIYYTVLILINGTWSFKLIVVFVIISVNLLTKYLMKSTDTAKSSSNFGLTTKID